MDKVNLSSDVIFWQTEGINNLYWQGNANALYYEGEGNAKVVPRLVGNRTVRDIGCGYGRLAHLYDPKKYMGFDICQLAAEKAKKLYPEYDFRYWEYLTKLPPAEVTIFVNGPHLVNDLEIQNVIDVIAQDTNSIIFSEPMDLNLKKVWGREYKTYVRLVETYDVMMSKNEFFRTHTHVGPHESVEGVMYTVACWDRVI